MEICRYWDWCLGCYKFTLIAVVFNANGTVATRNITMDVQIALSDTHSFQEI